MDVYIQYGSQMMMWSHEAYGCRKSENVAAELKTDVYYCNNNVVLCFTVLLAATVQLFYVVVHYAQVCRPVCKGALLLCMNELN